MNGTTNTTIRIIAAALLMAGAATTQALTINTFHGIVDDGPYAGAIGVGTFTYDETLLDESGDGTFSPTSGLTVTLSIFGQNFTEADDIDFNEFPELFVENFIPVELDFIVSEEGGNPIDIHDPLVVRFETDVLFAVASTAPLDISIAAVPLDFTTAIFVDYASTATPDGGSSLMLLGGALGLAAMGRRHMRRG